jgi:hypothetical protein
VRGDGHVLDGRGCSERGQPIGLRQLRSVLRSLAGPFRGTSSQQLLKAQS